MRTDQQFVLTTMFLMYCAFVTKKAAAVRAVLYFSISQDSSQSEASARLLYAYPSVISRFSKMDSTSLGEANLHCEIDMRGLVIQCLPYGR